MKERKLGTFQAISVVVSAMIAHIILNLPNHLIAETGSATILNIIYVFIISLIIFYIASKAFYLFPNSDIMDICEYTAGKTAKNLLGSAICIYLLIISAFVIRIFSESLVLIYFPNIDLEIVILIFIAITTIMNLFGFKTIARVSLLIIPIILFAMVVIFISCSSGFMPEKVFPILGYGVKETFVTGLR